MTIGEYVKGRPVYALQGNSTVLDAVKYMAEKNIGAVPVLEGTRLAGIFSERDVIKRIVAKGLDPRSVRVNEVMTSDIVVANAGESFEDCLRKMTQANCRHLPVVAGDEVLGVASMRDMMQVQITERDEKLEYLNSYMFHLPPGADQRYK